LGEKKDEKTGCVKQGKNEDWNMCKKRTDKIKSKKGRYEIRAVNTLG